MATNSETAVDTASNQNTARGISPKRARPRLQSGDSVKNLQKQNSSKFLQETTPENLDRDLKIVRQRSLKRLGVN